MGGELVLLWMLTDRDQQPAHRRSTNNHCMYEVDVFGCACYTYRLLLTNKKMSVCVSMVYRPLCNIQEYTHIQSFQPTEISTMHF